MIIFFRNTRFKVHIYHSVLCSIWSSNRSLYQVHQPLCLTNHTPHSCKQRAYILNITRPLPGYYTIINKSTGWLPIPTPIPPIPPGEPLLKEVHVAPFGATTVGLQMLRLVYHRVPRYLLPFYIWSFRYEVIVVLYHIYIKDTEQRYSHSYT